MSASKTADRIALHCVSCQAKLKASRQLLGQVLPCPRCRTPVFVNPPTPSDADICLIVEDRR